MRSIIYNKQLNSKPLLITLPYNTNTFHTTKIIFPLWSIVFGAVIPVKLIVKIHRTCLDENSFSRIFTTFIAHIF